MTIDLILFVVQNVASRNGITLKIDILVECDSGVLSVKMKSLEKLVKII